MGVCQIKVALTLFVCFQVFAETLFRSAFRQTKIPLSRDFALVCRGGGIRTPEPREGLSVFKTDAFNRSATPLCFG